ncbi:MAG TPA: DUF4404 family protein [Vampirovibrionales bacterium]
MNLVQGVEMIEDTIKRIELVLKSSKGLSQEKRDKLNNLLSVLKSEVLSLSTTNHEEANSIAKFTELSTHEATKAKQNKQLLNLSLEGLKKSVEEFEVSHPQLVKNINDFSLTLAGMGI